MKTFFLHGGTTRRDGNKGDALMLSEVTKRIRRQFGNDVRLVVWNDAGSFHEIAGAGYYQMVPYPKSRSRNPVRKAKWYLEWRYKDTNCEDLGAISENDFDGIINLMGYRYGNIGQDEGLRATRKDCIDYSRWYKNGKKIIFLPQAFGPFNGGEIRSCFNRIAKCSHRIYCRDQKSLECIKQLGPSQTTVNYCPDLTIATDTLPQESNSPLDGHFVIIPNLWMLRRVSDSQKGNFISRMNLVAEVCQANGVPVSMVLHAPFQDHLALDEIRSALEFEYSTWTEQDPIKLKASIGAALGVFSARYHGVLAGLTQGVPVMGASWAHKYEEVFSDYGCSEMLLRDSCSNEETRKLMEQYIFGPQREGLVNTLSERQVLLSKQVNEMWGDVFETIS